MVRLSSICVPIFLTFYNTVLWVFIDAAAEEEEEEDEEYEDDEEEEEDKNLPCLTPANGTLHCIYIAFS